MKTYLSKIGSTTVSILWIILHLPVFFVICAVGEMVRCYYDPLRDKTTCLVLVILGAINAGLIWYLILK